MIEKIEQGERERMEMIMKKEMKKRELRWSQLNVNRDGDTSQL
jgi:hypothetical protein